FDTSSGLPNDLVTSLLETVGPDGEPALWVGTNGGGIACLHRGAWTVFDTSSGLPMNQVACLLETREGARRTLWVGTYGGGIAWRDPDDPGARWQTLSDATVPGLPNNVVYQIQQDRRGRLYIFTNKGVARLTAR